MFVLRGRLLCTWSPGRLSRRSSSVAMLAKHNAPRGAALSNTGGAVGPPGISHVRSQLISASLTWSKNKKLSVCRWHSRRNFPTNSQDFCNWTQSKRQHAECGRISGTRRKITGDHTNAGQGDSCVCFALKWEIFIFPICSWFPRHRPQPWPLLALALRQIHPISHNFILFISTDKKKN